MPAVAALPTSDQLNEMWQAQFAKYDKLANEISKLSAILQERSAMQEFTTRAVVIPANSERSFATPTSAGGFLVTASDGVTSLATLQVNVGTVVKYLPDTTQAFVPLPGITAAVTLRNPTSSDFSVTVQTLAREYALLYAPQAIIQQIETTVLSLPLTAVVNQAANTDFAAFTATFDGSARFFFSLPTASIVNLMVTPKNGEQGSAGPLNDNQPISGPWDFWMDVTQDAGYALQVATAQVGTSYYSMTVGRY